MLTMVKYTHTVPYDYRGTHWTPRTAEGSVSAARWDAEGAHIETRRRLACATPHAMCSQAAGRKH